MFYYTVTGSGNGAVCDSLMYYVYLREVACNEWISDKQEWIPDNCQVL